jgi:putative addiction module component (TIGR02574 family)
MELSALNFKELPLSERIQLAQDIWDSIAEETSEELRLPPEELAELRQGLAEHQNQPDSGIPWQQVRSRLFVA